MTQSHCESSTGSCDGCRLQNSARWLPTFGPSW